MTNIIKISFILIALGLTLLGLGCKSQKRALRSVIKADVNYPTVVSGYCATKYPPKYGRGETITKIVQGETQIDTMVLFDTVNRETIKYLTKYRVDTFRTNTTDTVENTALANYWKAMYDKEHSDKLLVASNRDKVRGQRTMLIWFVSVLGGIFAIIGLMKFGLPKIPKI